MGVMTPVLTTLDVDSDLEDVTGSSTSTSTLGLHSDVDSETSSTALNELLKEPESIILRELRSLRHEVCSLRGEVGSLKKRMITVDDTERLHHAMTTRRAMILPWSHISYLMQDSVEMASLIGKVAD